MECHEDQMVQDQLRQLRARVKAGESPCRGELERALERGFGCLMALEAQLERVRRSRPPSGDADGEEQLRERIDALSRLLAELRGAGAGGRGSRAGYGFVLPHR